MRGAPDYEALLPWRLMQWPSGLDLRSRCRSFAAPQHFL